MDRFLSRTLIRTTTTTASTTAAVRRLSTLSGELTLAEAEARAVQKIEDAIHGIIVQRSKPDWLPFIPGSSYWVPPRPDSYGITEVFDKLSNALTDEENLSLVNVQGWPSSAFYVNHLDGASLAADGEISSANKPLFEDEGSNDASMKED